MCTNVIKIGFIFNTDVNKHIKYYTEIVDITLRRNVNHS